MCKSTEAYDRTPVEHSKYPDIPMFEQLEQRLLLSADIPGPQLALPAHDTSYEQAIEIDIDYQQEEAAHNEPAVIETLETPSSEDTEEVLSPVITLDNGDNNDLRAPELPGLQLVDPDISSWNGQIIYLDFDGQEDVTYNGPVTVGFDVPAFQGPGELTGQEQEIINQILAELEQTFAGTGIIFTTSRPAEGIEYSTIYIGGDDSVFDEYGSFLGLAEQVDVGNKNQCDEAFVFSNGLSTKKIVSVISHELAHLLGYTHVQANSGGTLEQVAATIAIEATANSYPTVGNDGDEICELGEYEAWFGFDVSQIPLDEEIVSATFTALMLDYGDSTQRTLWYDSDDSWIINDTDPVNKMPNELVGTVVQEGGWDWVTFNINLSSHDWSKDLADGYVTLILTGPLSGTHQCGTVDFRGAYLKLETAPVVVPSVTVTVSPSSVLEDGLTNMVYTFTRSDSSSDPLTVNFSAGGTATYIADYTLSGAAGFNGTSGTVVIPAGSTTAQVIVDPTPDISGEANETMILTVTSGTGYTVGSPLAATGTITNDDAVVPSVTVTVSPSSVLENGLTNIVYTFTRSGSFSNPLTVYFNAGGTATYIADYTLSVADSFNGTSGFVVIPAGSTTAQVIVDPTPDISEEVDETVILTVTSGTGYIVGSPSAATGTITNDDTVVPSVTVSVSPSSVLEDGLTNMVYTFTRSSSSTDPLTVNFIAGGTAIYIADYMQSGAAGFNGIIGTVVIPAGSTTARVIVDPTPDLFEEVDDTLILTVTSGTGYIVVSPLAATGVITNDDSNTVTVSATDSSASESGGKGTYRISRTGDTSSSLTVYYSMSGSATNGTDYNSLPGSVVIPKGLSYVDITLTPIDDTSVEGSETATLTISANAAYIIGSPVSASIDIVDDDLTPPTVRVDMTDDSASESGGTGTYRISRTGETSSSLTVYYSMSGSATNGTDYNNFSGSVVIPIGSSYADITLTPVDDTSVEGNETATLTLSGNPAYNIGSPNSAGVNVTDNDAAVFSINLDAKGKAQFYDANGDLVTVSLTGGGTGTLYFAHDGPCDIDYIKLTGTTEKSSLTINTRGSTTINDIIVYGPLKNISAKTTDLLGDITVNGWLGKIMMDDVADDHFINIGGSGQSKPTTFIFDKVADLTIESDTPINSIRAAEWLGGSITAPWISNLLIRYGNFNADIILNDSNTRGIALNRFSVAGTITDSDITAQGTIGSIIAGAMQNSSCFIGTGITLDINLDGVPDLPNPATDITLDPIFTIQRLTIKGIKGYSGDCFVNSNIAAANIGVISLILPQYDNTDVPFCLAADFIKKINITDNNGRQSYQNLGQPGDSITNQDCEFRLV